MFSKNTDKNFLRVPLVLYDLQMSETTEKKILALTVLNEVISSSQEEIEFLHKVKGFRIIMKYMRDDERMTSLCLKILVTASKKDAKSRKYLIENNIFGLLANQLQNEYNFSKNNIILYAALTVILVQENQEAQCLMRKSGCLSNFVSLLNYILDHSEIDGIPQKNTEMIIYAITSSIKNPRHIGNQIEIGRILEKIVNYLGKSFYFNNDDSDITKCFWSFLRNVLDRNEINQEIFTKCSGLIVLFRSLQVIIEDEKYQEHEDELSKITGVLVKLKSHKEFLYQSSNYCSIMILCLLMKINNSLVMRHVITFLSSLVREIPSTLYILNDSKIQILMRKELTAYSEKSTHLAQDLWDALEASLSLQGLPTFSGNLKQILNSDMTFECHSSGIGSLRYPQSDFCILHSARPLKQLQNYSGSLLNYSQTSCVGDKEKFGGSLDHWKYQGMKLVVAHLNFHPKQLKREQKLREKMTENPTRDCQLFRSKKSRSSFVRMTSRGIFQVFQKFWSYFSKARSSSDLIRWKKPVVVSYQFTGNQLLEYK